MSEGRQIYMLKSFQTVVRSLEMFHSIKVSWELYSRHFNFVKQTPCKIILTQIFLDAKFIATKLPIKMAMHEFGCESCI